MARLNMGLRLFLVLLLSYVTGVAAQTTCLATDKKIIYLNNSVRNPVQFCAWWRKTQRFRSPFVGMELAQVSQACSCITKNSALGKTTMPAKKAIPAGVTGTKRNNLILANNVSDNTKWCSFWNALKTRTWTPFTDLTVKSMYPLCESVVAAASTASRTTTSSKTSSTSKTTSSKPASVTTTSKATSPAGTMAPTTNVNKPTQASITTTASISKTVRACGADPTSDLLPVANAAKSTEDVSNLTPAKSLSLYYAQPAPGKTAAILTLAMRYPAVDLSSSSFPKSVSCSLNTITFTIPKGSTAANAAVAAWPKQMAILTKNAGCNVETQRGIWLSSDISKTDGLLATVYTIKASPATWTDVAETMEVSYGERELKGISYKSACAKTYSPTTTSSPSATPMPWSKFYKAYHLAADGTKTYLSAVEPEDATYYALLSSLSGITDASAFEISEDSTALIWDAPEDGRSTSQIPSDGGDVEFVVPGSFSSGGLLLTRTGSTVRVGVAGSSASTGSGSTGSGSTGSGSTGSGSTGSGSTGSGSTGSGSTGSGSTGSGSTGSGSTGSGSTGSGSTGSGSTEPGSGSSGSAGATGTSAATAPPAFALCPYKGDSSRYILKYFSTTVPTTCKIGSLFLDPVDMNTQPPTTTAAPAASGPRILNPSFETAGAGPSKAKSWNLFRTNGVENRLVDQTVAEEGKAYITFDMVPGSKWDEYVWQAIDNVVPGKTYTVSMWWKLIGTAKKDPAAPAPRLNIWIDDDHSQPIDLSDVGKPWAKYSIDYKVPADKTSIKILFGTSSNNNAANTHSYTLAIDNVDLQEKSTTATTTTTSTTTKRGYVEPTALSDLSAGALDLVNFITNNTRLSTDGLIIVTPKSVNMTNVTAAWSPTDGGVQDNLESSLLNAGLDKPNIFKLVADATMAGLCLNSASTAPSKRSLLETSPVDYSLDKRTPSPAGFDIGTTTCKGFVKSFTGLDGTAMCEGKDAVDFKEAWKCMFKGCYLDNTPAAPGFDFEFTRSYSSHFYFPPDTPVASWSGQGSLTCKDCFLDISEVKIKGSIKVTLQTGTILDAAISVSEKSTANMILELSTTGALAKNWNTKANTIDLDPVTLSGVFSITPSVIFSLGAEFSTDAAVDVVAGSKLAWTGASADVNLVTGTTTNINGWAPTMDNTYPIFRKAATVKMYPYMRRLYKLSFSIFGTKAGNSVTFTSQTNLGYNTQYLDVGQAAGKCTANQLRLLGFSANKQTVLLESGVTKVLNSRSDQNPEQCFDVPLTKPTDDEMTQLKASGQEFCTSYVSYYGPKVAAYTSGTTSIDSTTSYLSPLAVTTTPTIFKTSTVTVPITQVWSAVSTSTGAAQGAQSLASQYQKRNAALPATIEPTMTIDALALDYNGPVMTAVPNAFSPNNGSDIALLKRNVATPAVVNGWEATKISYACKLLATGTDTITFTTSYATVVTATVTTTLPYPTLAGVIPLTSTFVSTEYSWTTSTAYASTATVAAACPIQTQQSCFQIRGHGVASVEGKLLGLQSQMGQASFINDPTTFYLTCDGSLVALPDVRALITTSGLLDFQRFDSTTQSARIKCKKDEVTKRLTCVNSDGSAIMYVWNPANPYWNTDFYDVTPKADYRIYEPTFTAGSVTNDWMPITLTYESATCPCGDPITKDVAIYNAKVPDCPTADGTVVTSSGYDFQVQCGVGYKWSTIDNTTATTLGACLAKCAPDLECVLATWSPTTNTCTRRYGVQTAPFAGTEDYPLHSLIRLKVTGPPNIMANADMQGSGAAVGVNSVFTTNTLVMPGWSTTGTIRAVDNPDIGHYAELAIDNTNTAVWFRQDIILTVGKWYKFAPFVDYGCTTGGFTVHYHANVGSTNNIFKAFDIPTGTKLKNAFTRDGPYVFQATAVNIALYYHLLQTTSGTLSCSFRVARSSLLGPYDSSALALA